MWGCSLAPADTDTLTPPLSPPLPLPLPRIELVVAVQVSWQHRILWLREEESLSLSM